jgi:hypothetical protein
MFAASARRSRTDSPVGVQLSDEVDRDIRLRVLEGVKALPRRGLEIGGFLTGQASSEEISVNGLTPVESSYPEGPAFRATQTEIEAAMEAAAAQGDIVGFYRSRTDGVLELEDQDYRLLEAIPLQGAVAVVLIGQTRDTPARMSIGVWESGHLYWQAPVAEAESAAAASPETRLDVAVDPPASRRWRPYGASAASLLLVTLVLAIGVSSRSTDSAAIRGSRENQGEARTRVIFGQLSHSPKAAVQPVKSDLPRVLRDVAKDPRARTVVPPVEVAKTVPRAFVAPALNPGPGTKGTPLLGAPPPLPIQYEAPKISAPQVVVPPPPRPAPPKSASGLASTVEVTSPTLARQPKPVVLPPDLRALLQHEILLPLRVKTDAAGNVTGIQPDRTLNTIEQALFRSYANAVSTWQFEPGTRDGLPVPSETVLRFRVMPKDR